MPWKLQNPRVQAYVLLYVNQKLKKSHQNREILISHLRNETTDLTYNVMIKEK